MLVSTAGIVPFFTYVTPVSNHITVTASPSTPQETVDASRSLMEHLGLVASLPPPPLTEAHLSRIGIAQPTVVPGRPDINVREGLRIIDQAKAMGLDVIALPEMFLSGYLIGDNWEQDDIVKDFMVYNERLREASRGITVIWGGPYAEVGNREVRGEDGRTRKYNAAFIARDGEWVSNGVFAGRTYKSLEPKYRMFDDERHFFPMTKLAAELSEKHGTWVRPQDLLKPFPLLLDGRVTQAGIILCEDMWQDDYAINPTEILIRNGAEVILNLSCSPWSWRKNDKRHRVVRNLMRDHDVWMFYANSTGIQNNGKNVFLFDGGSTIHAGHGRFHKALAPYETGILTTRSEGPQVLDRPVTLSDEQDMEELFQGLIQGIRHFFGPMASKKVLVGLSGGIDSALNAALLSLALGAENVYTVSIPSEHNSETTKSDSRRQAAALGVRWAEVPIQESVENTIRQLTDLTFRPNSLSPYASLSDDEKDGVNENIQARDRGARLLAAIAASLGAVFSNNGNKTEIGFGYATLYGDVGGALSIIGDLTKGQVWALSEYINRKFGRELILQSIIDRKPSAELSRKQAVDEGKGDPMQYTYHDRLIVAWVEERLTPMDLMKMYAEGTLDAYLSKPKVGMPPAKVADFFPTPQAFLQDLLYWWDQFTNSVFKRVQGPPIIAVSKRAFGFDLRESMKQARDRYLSLEGRELSQQIIRMEGHPG